MTDAPSSPEERVRRAAAAAGVAIEIVRFDVPMPTAAAAAERLGCEVGRIAKSLVFAVDGTPLVVLAPGDRVVDHRRLADERGVGRRRVRQASPETVLEVTGFVVGGVAPCGHLRPVDVLVDEGLFRFDSVFAAGGTPPTLFEVAPTDLLRVARGRRVDVTKERA
ncbi:MAG: YbaK/EbsC family protein [Planctomycetota bacterium JB042]